MNTSDPYERLRGKRYIASARCSTIGQADTSIPDQIHAIETFAGRYGMVKVDQVLLEGISGSMPGKREDLQTLLDRKQRRNDFEAVLVQDTTRLTRGGTGHGMHIEHEFTAAGIEIVFVMEQALEGPAGDMMKTFQYFSGKEQARSIGKNAARGAMSAMEQGRMSHTHRPPITIDRMYVGPDGVARHIIRNMADGSQVRLDPKTGAAIERFGIHPRTGRPAHYLKQPDETIRLVPGDPRLGPV